MHQSIPVLSVVCMAVTKGKRKEKREQNACCFIKNVTTLICIQPTYHVLLKFGLEMGLEISESAAKLHSHRIRFILSYRILLQTFPPQFCMFSALKMKEILYGVHSQSPPLL